MNEVELAQKMIMNFFKETLKDDFTPEQEEIVKNVLRKVTVAYGELPEKIADAGGQYNKEEEKIIISNENLDKQHYIQTLIHEYGHALSHFDYCKTGININSIIEEGMVELFKELVIEFNKNIKIEAYDTYKDETAITRTIMAGLHESKKDMLTMAKYLLGGTDKEKSGFLEDVFGVNASKINPLEDENLFFRDGEIDYLYEIVAESVRDKKMSDKIPNIYTKNNPLLIFSKMQDIIPNIIELYLSEKEATGKVECYHNSIDEYIISKAVLRDLKNGLRECKNAGELREIYQIQEEKLQRCLQIVSETTKQETSNYGCQEILQILKNLPLDSGRYSMMDLVRQLPPRYEDFEKISELLLGEGLVDMENIFMIDQYQYTELMNAVNNESSRTETKIEEKNSSIQEPPTVTPEQRKISFVRSRNIDTQMDLEVQEQVNKDIREHQQEKDGQEKDIFEN